MQPELQALFEAQAAWQRARAGLSWPEKIRMAEAMREGAWQLRRSPVKQTGREPGPPSPTTSPSVSER